jgi:hypothetical protein
MPPTGGHPCPVPLDNQETLASSGKITEALPRPGTGAGHRPISHKIQPMHPLLTQVSYPLAPPAIGGMHSLGSLMVNGPYGIRTEKQILVV